MGSGDVDEQRIAGDMTESFALSERSDGRGMEAGRAVHSPAKRGGNQRIVIREVVNALMYVLSTGCQWRAIPKDLPPRSTVHGYFDLWSWDRTLDRIHPTRALHEVSRGDRT